MNQSSSLAQGAVSRRDALRFGIAGGTVLAAAGLGACSGSGSKKDSSGRQPVKIRYWTHDKVLSVPLLQYWAKKLSAEPSAKYAYTIEPTIIPPSDLPTKARAAFLAHNSKAPDLLNIEVNSFSRVMPVAKDTLVDLTQTIAPVRGKNLPNLSDTYSVDGRAYGVELSAALCTFYYRTDQFKQLGLPTSFATWDDAFAAAEKYAVPKGKYFGYVSGDGTPNGAALSYLAYLVQRGGNIFGADGSAVLDSAEAVDALALLQRAVQAKVLVVLTGTSTGPLVAALKKSQLIAGLEPDYYERFTLGQLVPEQKGKWHMTTLPKFSGGGSNTSILGGSSFSVAKNSPVKDAALELVKRSVLTEEGQLVKYQRVNFKPTWRSVFTDPAILAAKDSYMGGQHIGKVYAELAPETPIIYQSPKWASALEALNGPVLDALKGNKTPAQAIKDASVAIGKLQ